MSFWKFSRSDCQLLSGVIQCKHAHALWCWVPALCVAEPGFSVVMTANYPLRRSWDSLIVPRAQYSAGEKIRCARDELGYFLQRLGVQLCIAVAKTTAIKIIKLVNNSNN
jgi:hypothetical protein